MQKYTLRARLEPSGAHEAVEGGTGHAGDLGDGGTSQFKRDYKLESGGRHRAHLDAGLARVIETLAKDEPLEPRHHDHALSGEWSDHRDCHVKPDLVLIYQKAGTDTLRLVRLGSHSELGL